MQQIVLTDAFHMMYFQHKNVNIKAYEMNKEKESFDFYFPCGITLQTE
jgi:hypothetical protein